MSNPTTVYLLVSADGQTELADTTNGRALAWHSRSKADKFRRIMGEDDTGPLRVTEAAWRADYRMMDREPETSR